MSTGAPPSQYTPGHRETVTNSPPTVRRAGLPQSINSFLPKQVVGLLNSGGSITTPGYASGKLSPAVVPAGTHGNFASAAVAAFTS